jgi:hypothetical protein
VLPETLRYNRLRQQSTQAELDTLLPAVLGRGFKGEL